MKLSCARLIFGTFLFLIPCLLAFFSYEYHVLKEDIVQIDANLVSALPGVDRGYWYVTLTYNFTATDKKTYKGIAVQYLTPVTTNLQEWANKENILVYYHTKDPKINGFAYFLDLSGWIAGVTIFAILSCCAIPALIYLVISTYKMFVEDRTWDALRKKKYEEEKEEKEKKNAFSPVFMGNYGRGDVAPVPEMEEKGLKARTKKKQRKTKTKTPQGEAPSLPAPLPYHQTQIPLPTEENKKKKKGGKNEKKEDKKEEKREEDSGEGAEDEESYSYFSASPHSSSSSSSSASSVEISASASSDDTSELEKKLDAPLNE